MDSPFKDRIVEGMEVRSVDGDKLGKVVSTHAESFMIEKGFFFPKDYLVSFDHVKDVREGTVHLGLTKQDLREGGSLLDKARSRLEGVGSEGRVPPEGQGREEIRVPLREEEVIVGRHEEEVVREEVVVSKEPEVEQAPVSETVRREVADVETSGKVRELDVERADEQPPLRKTGT